MILEKIACAITNFLGKILDKEGRRVDEFNRRFLEDNQKEDE